LAVSVLDRDKNIAAWTGVYFASMRIDDLTVPVVGTAPHAPIEPSPLSGHAMEAANQIVLAPGTLAQLHKRVGDTVEAGSGAKRKRLVIVGTAALPAVGIATNLHTELSTGAVVADTLIPTSNRGFGRRDGPEAIFVRLRTNIPPAAALLTLKRDAAGMSTDPNDGPVSVLGVQRPAEIVNYRTMGTTPAFLGVGLAVGAAGALGLTLIASVRRRRRDLALLKTLGFTGRQLAAVVIWQASVAAVIGTVVGLPLGIIVGRELWNRFAAAIHVVPSTSVPGVSIALVALGALLLANLVAAIPGRQAARTPSALLLHAD
jgi:predicted lysophospholipase L1 biosynthesis ABC-type transport system permease subunit